MLASGRNSFFNGPSPFGDVPPLCRNRTNEPVGRPTHKRSMISVFTEAIVWVLSVAEDMADRSRLLFFAGLVDLAARARFGGLPLREKMIGDVIFVDIADVLNGFASDDLRCGVLDIVEPHVWI